MTPAINIDTVERALHAWVTSTSGIPGSRIIWSDRARERPDTQWISLKLELGEQDGYGWVTIEDNPLVFAPITVTTVNVTTDTLTAVAHTLVTGDGPVRLDVTSGLSQGLPMPMGAGSTPDGLALGVDYWVVVIDADHLQLSSSYLNSIASTPVVIDIGPGVGAGVLRILSTADTVRSGAELAYVVHAYFDATLKLQCYGGAATGGFSPKSVLQTVVASLVLPSVRNALEDGDCGPVKASAVHDVGAVINTASYEPRAAVDVSLWVTSQVSETGGRIDSVEATISTPDEGDVTFSIP